MAEKSMVVIGGGLAGLSVGCYARMNGWRTRILELHSQPGGVCTAWARGGYTIDGCIHWLMGARPGSGMHRVYRELGLVEGGRLVGLTRYMRMVDERGGSVDFTWDLDRLAEELLRLAPEDRRAIGELVDDVRIARGFPMDVLKPAALAAWHEKVGMVWRMRNVLPLLLRLRLPVSEYVLRFRNAALRRFLLNLFLPEMPAFFIFVVLGQLAAGELGLYRGGSLAFARAVEARYRALGGAIDYRSPVARILVEGDRAVGVRLEDGQEHRADVVVSAADARSTLFGMLDGRFVDEAWRTRFATWPLFRPIVLASYGVAATYEDQPHSSAIFLERPLRVAGQSVEGIHLRILHYDPSLAPPGKTVVQVMLESDWDWWARKRDDRDAYRAEKDRLAEEVLLRLERHLPGIAAKVEMTDVATPHTFWRYTRNHRGAYEGWLPTVRAVKDGTLPRTLPGLRGFFLAGQWIEPGGGIPPALYGGRHLLQRICRDEGTAFVTTVP
jgi:phytoene desaturase